MLCNVIISNISVINARKYSDEYVNHPFLSFRAIFAESQIGVTNHSLYYKRYNIRTLDLKCQIQKKATLAIAVTLIDHQLYFASARAVYCRKMRLSRTRPGTSLSTIMFNIQSSPQAHISAHEMNSLRQQLANSNNNKTNSASRSANSASNAIPRAADYLLAFITNRASADRDAYGKKNSININRLFDQAYDDKTFVSGHYRVLSSDIVDYLYRKKVEFVEHPMKFTLKFCPFCPPHKFQSDNLFKHEIFKNTGNSYCHRCNYRGSLFDLKKAFGDLDGSLFSSFKSYQNGISIDNSDNSSPSDLVNSFTMDDVMEYADNLYNPKFCEVLDFLKNRGLTDETLRKYYVGAGEFAFSTITSAPFKGLKNVNSPKSTQVLHKCIVFPWLTQTKNGLSVERIKIRSISNKSKFKILPPNGSWGLFGDHLRVDKVNEIVLTEGEIDAMSVNQASGKIALSFPNGANSLPIPVLPRLESIEKLYIWLDFDAAGQNSVEHFANKLGLGRTLVVREIDLDSISVVGSTESGSIEPAGKRVVKDANDALMQNINLDLYLKNARQISHSQIMSFKDLRQMVYDELSNPASTCGIPSLTIPGITELIRGHRRGELSVWTGPTGAGKTTLLSQLSLDYCVQGIPTLWGSFEINNVRLAKMMLRQFCGRNLEKDLGQFDFYADKFQQLPLKFMKFHGSTSIDQVIDAMDYAAYVFDVGHIIIDNLQFMLSGQQGKALDVWDLQNRAIEKFRRFSTTKNVHISLVVHPRKEADGAPLGLSSVFGSVKSTQEADNVFIVQNVVGQHRSIDVKKNRFAGRLGRVLFRFDPVSLTAQQLSLDAEDGNSPGGGGLKGSLGPGSGLGTGFDATSGDTPRLASIYEINHRSQPLDADASLEAVPLGGAAANAGAIPGVEGGSENLDKSDARGSPEGDLGGAHIKPVKAVGSDSALKGASTEGGAKTTVILRSVSVDENSSIADLRKFIKANNLNNVIKTAGKGIKKNDVFQKILLHVPPSTINRGLQSRSYSTVPLHSVSSDYPFTISGAVPILDRELACDKFPNLFSRADCGDLYVYTPKKKLSDKLTASSFIYINNEKQIESVTSLLSGCKMFGIDTETTGLNPRQDSIRLIQISTPKGLTVIFDMLKIKPETLLGSGVLQKLLTSSAMKIFHNAKFDLSFLRILGVDKDLAQFQFNPLSLPIFDTLIASKLVEASRLPYGFKLDQVCQRYLGLDLDKTQQYSDWTVPALSEEQVLYSASDSAVMLPLYESLRDKIVKAGLETVADIEFRCVLAVVDMEMHGIQVDKNKLDGLWKQLHEQRDLAEKKLKSKLGSDINCNSQPQLVKALQNLGVKDIYTKRLILDTNESTLSRNSFHPAVFALREYRKWNKAVSAFVDKLPKHICKFTDRIHPNFNQCGTGSGRFSCDNPNLQQIPRDAKFRSCFVPLKGYKFAIADLSQIELRIAADISQDETMINAYLKGQDLHALTASLIKNKKLADVTKEERQVAKAVNFGLLFGMTPITFRQYAESMYNVKITLQQAKAFHQSFFNCYKGITRWHESIKNEKPLQVRTLTNRISIFDTFSFTKSLNYPVQGTSADIIKEALANIIFNVKDIGARLVMCVHDEVIIEVPEARAEEGLDILVKTMEDAGNKFLRHVPCVAQGSIGTSWADK